MFIVFFFFFFQAEDGIRDFCLSRGLGDVYKRQVKHIGHFIRGYARSTVQLKAREILAKMGASSGSLLKDVLFSLSEELKGY